MERNKVQTFVSKKKKKKKKNLKKKKKKEKENKIYFPFFCAKINTKRYS